MAFCIRVKQGSKESTKEHQLQKGIHDAWHKGKSSNLSHTRVPKQLHTSIQTVLVTIREIVVKSALILGQTNAQSEQSLSVNARIVTQDRASLDEKTIVGLHVVKDAVRFFDTLTN